LTGVHLKVGVKRKDGKRPDLKKALAATLKDEKFSARHLRRGWKKTQDSHCC